MTPFFKKRKTKKKTQFFSYLEELHFFYLFSSLLCVVALVSGAGNLGILKVVLMLPKLGWCLVPLSALHVVVGFIISSTKEDKSQSRK